MNKTVLIIVVVVLGVFVLLFLLRTIYAICSNIKYKKEHPYSLDFLSNEVRDSLASAYANAIAPRDVKIPGGGGFIRYESSMFQHSIPSAIRGGRLSYDQLEALKSFVLQAVYPDGTHGKPDPQMSLLYNALNALSRSI